jgi:hypothetical protein
VQALFSSGKHAEIRAEFERSTVFGTVERNKTDSFTVSEEFCCQIDRN